MSDWESARIQDFVMVHTNPFPADGVMVARKMHSVIPAALRANVSTHSPFWDILNRRPCNVVVYVEVKFVAVCVRSAWSQCNQQSGGSGVHSEMPEALVLTEVHLGLLDSETEDTPTDPVCLDVST